MSGDVVLLPGVSKPSAGAHEQPVESVVEILSSILAEAQQGRVRAVAVAFVDEVGTPSMALSFNAPEGRRNDLVSAVAIMQHDLMSHIRENSPIQDAWSNK